MSLGINIILNSYFAFLLHWGALSIALATSISTVCQFVFLIIQLKKEGLYLHVLQVFLIFFKVLVLCVFAFWIARFVKMENGEAKFWVQLSSFCVQSILYIVFLGLSAKLLNIEEINAIFDLLRGVRKKE